jgi:hypothetical protein
VVRLPPLARVTMSPGFSRSLAGSERADAPQGRKRRACSGRVRSAPSELHAGLSFHHTVTTRLMLSTRSRLLSVRGHQARGVSRADSYGDARACG